MLSEAPILLLFTFGIVSIFAITWKLLWDLVIRPFAPVSLWTWLYIGASLPKFSFRVRFAAPPEESTRGIVLFLYEFVGFVAAFAPVLAISAILSLKGNPEPSSIVHYFAGSELMVWLVLGAVVTHGFMSLYYGHQMPDTYDHTKALRALSVPELIKKMFANGAK